MIQFEFCRCEDVIPKARDFTGGPRDLARTAEMPPRVE